MSGAVMAGKNSVSGEMICRRASQSSLESLWLSAALELSSRGFAKNSNAEFGPLWSHELGEALSFYPSLFQQPQSVEPLTVHEGPVVLNSYQTTGSVC